MKNPFKAVGEIEKETYTDASESDCAPGPAEVGVTLLTPIVAPVTFVAALFEHQDKPKE